MRLSPKHTTPHRSRFWIFGPACGMVGALVLATGMTIGNWLKNPEGIFHGTDGTNWWIVAETALSWWVPTFCFISIIAMAAHLIRSATRKFVRKGR